MRQRSFVIICAAAVLCASYVHAQPAAVEQIKGFVDRGVIAAEQKDWAVALKYFYDAAALSTKTDPTLQSFFPPIALNAALAHVQLGNELLAIMWFHVYLAAAPQAPNAATVKSEIARMEVALQSKIRRLLDDATATARGGKYATTERANQEVLGYVAVAHARAGDLQAALRLASGIEKLMTLDDTSLADHIAASYAWSLAIRGQLNEAAKIVDQTEKLGRTLSKADWRPVRQPFEETIGGNRNEATDRFWLAIMATYLNGVDMNVAPQDQLAQALDACAMNDPSAAKSLVSRIHDTRKRQQLTEFIAELESLPCGRSALFAWLRIATDASDNVLLRNLPEALKTSSECAFTYMKERVPCLVPVAAAFLHEQAEALQTVARRLARPGLTLFGSVGLVMAPEKGRIVVREVVSGGPADQAGIRVGDEIIEVDGQPVRTTTDAFKRIRGPRGTTVVINVRRASQAVVSITVTREVIPS